MTPIVQWEEHLPDKRPDLRGLHQMTRTGTVMGYVPVGDEVHAVIVRHDNRLFVTIPISCLIFVKDDK